MCAPRGNKFAAGKGTKTALERFAMKCAFDPYTGCVMWIGERHMDTAIMRPTVAFGMVNDGSLTDGQRTIFMGSISTACRSDIIVHMDLQRSVCSISPV